MSIEPIVVVRGRGRIEGTDMTLEPNTEAHCQSCDQDVELVVELGGTPLCTDCLRAGLDAASVGRYRLVSSSGLPWGKVTS